VRCLAVVLFSWATVSFAVADPGDAEKAVCSCLGWAMDDMGLQIIARCTRRERPRFLLEVEEWTLQESHIIEGQCSTQCLGRVIIDFLKSDIPELSLQHLQLVDASRPMPAIRHATHVPKRTNN
jgi:hypothetical protein